MIVPEKEKKWMQRVQKYKKHDMGGKNITPRSKENGQEVTGKGSRNNQKMYKTIAGNYVWMSQKHNTTSSRQDGEKKGQHHHKNVQTGIQEADRKNHEK